MKKVNINLNVILSVLAVLYGISCTSPKDDRAFRIGAGNLNYKNQEQFKLTRAIVRADPDIFICLEWTGSNLDTGYLKNNGYKLVLDYQKKGTHGTCVLAKQNYAALASIAESPVSGPCRIPFAFVSLRRNDKSITIIGIHVPPPVSGCKNTSDETIDSDASWITDGKLNKDIATGKKGDYAAVMGDFNALSSNTAIKQLGAHGLIDCRAGFLSRATWAPIKVMPALLRIDYIFASHYLDIQRSETFRLPHSDHKAIVTEIRF
jgi:endonuclease/exonuclease/phosphatase (EEP) superfamily protein YafD